MSNSLNHPGKPKRGGVRAQVLLAAGSTILFLVVLEIVLRLTHLFGAHVSYSTPDPLIKFHLVPNSTYWNLKENEHPITGTINKWGWRDRDWSLVKTANQVRIAVLGDSYVEAFQVEDDSTFLRLVERRVNATDGARIELMNFGASGFTTSEEYLVLATEVWKFSPDMVILFFNPENDITDISRETAPDTERPFYVVDRGGGLSLDTSFTSTSRFRMRKWIDPWKRRSALLSLILDRYNLLRRSVSETPLREQFSQGVKVGRLLETSSLCTHTPDTTYLWNYRLNKRLFKKIAQYGRAKSMRFMLVCQDLGEYTPSKVEGFRKIDSTFDANFFEG